MINLIVPVSYFQINPENVTEWREQKEKPPRKHDQNLHTEGDYIINYTWFITVIYRGIEQFGRPQRSKLDLSWTDWEPMNRVFPHI